MNKAYSFGLLLGRFQTLHLGHCGMIDKALELSDEVGILIGSSQEERTSKNPFSFDERKAMLKTIYGDKLNIQPLPDAGLGNVAAWGDHVLEKCDELFGKKPDLFVSGKEERRSDWFSSEKGNSISELFVPKTIEISASALRGYLINDEKEKWMGYVDENLWPNYEEYRKIVMACMDEKETSSI